MLLLRPRRRCEVSVETDIKDDVDWIYLARDRVQPQILGNTVGLMQLNQIHVEESC
jgi:hypothetical protein